MFQVKATDPDDPADPEGQLRYLFLDNGDDLEAFHIGMFAFYLNYFTGFIWSLVCYY